LFHWLIVLSVLILFVTCLIHIKADIAGALRCLLTGIIINESVSLIIQAVFCQLFLTSIFYHNGILCLLQEKNERIVQAQFFPDPERFSLILQLFHKILPDI